MVRAESPKRRKMSRYVIAFALLLGLAGMGLAFDRVVVLEEAYQEG